MHKLRINQMCTLYYFMKRTIKFFCLLLISVNAFSQSPAGVSIIPQPVSVVKGAGFFTLPKNVIIQAPSSPELAHTVAMLRERLSEATGYNVTSVSTSPTATIRLRLNAQPDPKVGNEGYSLSVTP